MRDHNSNIVKRPSDGHQVYRDGIGICKDVRRTRFCLTVLLDTIKPAGDHRPWLTEQLALLNATDELPDEDVRMRIEALYRSVCLKHWQNMPQVAPSASP